MQEIPNNANSADWSSVSLGAKVERRDLFRRVSRLTSKSVGFIRYRDIALKFMIQVTGKCRWSSLFFFSFFFEGGGGLFISPKAIAACFNIVVWGGGQVLSSFHRVQTHHFCLFQLELFFIFFYLKNWNTRSLPFFQSRPPPPPPPPPPPFSI